ncbi:hypothetical protein ACL02O_26235 [Micromonospora sp. MS34]|uniref:hypothetical protein n=1 Tax=Micromonospora sp. MS34 TaxID=3385971 RepID=UPI0039A234DB
MSRLTRLLTTLLLGTVAVAVTAAPARAADPVDLVLSASGQPDPVQAWATVTYQATVLNRGPGAATATVVTAPLPAGTSFLAADSDSRCAGTPTLVTCDLGTLPASAAASPLIIALRPTEAGLLSVTFTASAAEPDADLSDNTRTVTTTVDAPTEADLALQLSPPLATVYAGATFFIGVEVTNAGPAPATGVTTTLRMPAGLTVLSGASCVTEGTGSVCTRGGSSLPPSAGESGPIALTAAGPGDWTISGSVTADQPDPQPADNAASTTFTTLPAANLAVAIGESADPTPPGRPFTWTLTVTNHGPSPSAVQLTHEWSTTVSGGLALLSVGASQGGCQLPVTGRMECDLGLLPDGATTTVTVTLRPQGPGTVTGRTRAIGDEYDPDPTDNAVEETTTVR